MHAHTPQQSACSHTRYLTKRLNAAKVQWSSSAPPRRLRSTIMVPAVRRTCLAIWWACVGASTLRGERSVGLMLDALGQKPTLRAVAFDVGTNNGKWVRFVASRASERRVLDRLRFVMFEPHPRFRARLEALALQVNGTFHPAAAWISDTNLTFFSAREKEGSSLVGAMALAYSNANPASSQFRPMTVAAVDLASVVERAIEEQSLSAAPVFALLKLDVEAAECE